MKRKLKMMLNFRNKQQLDLMEVWKMASKQSLNNKISLERFTLEDMIKACEFLNYDLIIADRSTGDQIVKFDINDIKKES